MVFACEPGHDGAMREDLELQGHAAIDFIVARAAPALAQLWDGANERVAHILQKGGEATVGFWPRAQAVSELRRRALGTEHARHATRLAEMAAAVEQGPPERLVQCVFLGWEDCLLIELEPDDLRDVPGVAAPVTNEDYADMFAQCSTQAGATRALDEIRNAFTAEAGKQIAELEQLASAVATRWNDISVVAVAAARARAATEASLGTAAGQRARFILVMLAEATAKRAAVGVSSPGGAA